MSYQKKRMSSICLFFPPFFPKQRDARERLSVRFPTVTGRPVGAASRCYYCLSIFVVGARLGNDSAHQDRPRCSCDRRGMEGGSEAKK